MLIGRRMTGTLAKLKDDRHAARLVDLGAQPHADCREDAHRQQIAAGLLDRAGAIPVAGMQRELAAHLLLVDLPQALEPDLADPHPGSGLDVEAHVEQRIHLILVGHRRVDLREGISLFLERRQQLRARIDDVGRHGRRTGLKRQEVLRRGRQLAVDGDRAHMIKRAEHETDRNRGLAVRRQRRQGFREPRVGERQGS